jgi:hypothetical protein
LRVRSQATFEIEEDGNEADDGGNASSHMLGDFVGYVTDTKVILLEELATKFGLPTQEAISRLKDLENMGTYQLLPLPEVVL